MSANPSSQEAKALEMAIAQASAQAKIIEKNKQAAREMLLRMQLILSQRPISSK